MFTYSTIILLIVPAILTFSSYTPSSYPDSLKQPELCGTTVPGLLCDPAKQLNEGGNISANHHLIERQLNFARYNTTCKCAPTDTNIGQCMGGRGFTVSVAVVDKMVLDEDQHDRSSRMRAAETFANSIRDKFPRGQCDDDVVIFLSVKDNAVWTSVGVVSQRYLTPELINSITLKAEEYFLVDKYTDGLLYMIESYTSVLNGQKIEIANNKGWYWPIPLWAVIVIGIVSVILIVVSVFLCICCCVKKCCCKERRGEYNTVEMNSRL